MDFQTFKVTRSWRSPLQTMIIIMLSMVIFIILFSRNQLELLPSVLSQSSAIYLKNPTSHSQISVPCPDGSDSCANELSSPINPSAILSDPIRPPTGLHVKITGRSTHIDAGREKRPDCIVFSCSPRQYDITLLNIKAVNVSVCDRAHYYVDTFNEYNEKISGAWCRVAILRQMKYWFPRYKRIFYADLDTIYYEHKINSLKCGAGLKGFVISSKIEKKEEVLRTNWFYICDSENTQIQDMIEKWSERWKEARYQDQTVLNENWSCEHFNCVSSKVIEAAHCGSYLHPNERAACMQARY